MYLEYGTSVRRLRNLTQAAREQPPAIPAPEPSGEVKASRVWSEIRAALSRAATNGMYHIRFSQFISQADAAIILARVRKNLEARDFVWRYQGTTSPDGPVKEFVNRTYNQGSPFEFVQPEPKSQPVVNAGCYHAVYLGDKCELADGIAEGDGGQLYVEANWQPQGFCLTCGEEHVQRDGPKAV